ncbi:aminotransferase [Spirochaetota bacterium]|nr:aminotransferase [Spirochaetota bacterium]
MEALFQGNLGAQPKQQSSAEPSSAQLSSMDIPFHRVDVGEREAAAVREVILSGWINTGPRVKAFETALKTPLQAETVVAVSSAWAGLFLTLRAFGIGRGDEVITTPFTFAATANVIEQVGATPVFIDVDESHTLDATKLAQTLSRRTKAIIPVDIGGRPANYAALLAALHDFYLGTRAENSFEPGVNVFQNVLGRPLILADAAHAFGSHTHERTTYKGDIRVYSFHTVKNITTIDGGAIAICLKKLSEAASVTDSKLSPSHTDKIHSQSKKPTLTLASQLRALALHGMDKSAYERTQLQSLGYDIISAGYKCNLTDVAAAMGIVQLQRWQAIAAARDRLYQKYHNHFKESPYLSERSHMAYVNDWHIAPHLYTLCIKKAHGRLFLTYPTPERYKIRAELLKVIAAAGIATNIHYMPLYNMKYYSKHFNQETIRSDFPVTDALSSSIFSLPFHALLTQQEITKIINAVTMAAEQVLGHSA